MIGQLIEIGRAYRTDDGVYLSVETVEDYGLLAHQSLSDMLVGGGVSIEKTWSRATDESKR